MASQWYYRKVFIKSIHFYHKYTKFTRLNASDGSKITNYYGNLHHLGNKTYHYCCQRFKKCDFEINTALEEIKRRP